MAGVTTTITKRVAQALVSLGVHERQTNMINTVLNEYGHPTRFYHTQNNVAYCFAQLPFFNIDTIDAHSVVALFFHDVIYRLPVNGSELTYSQMPSEFKPYVTSAQWQINNDEQLSAILAKQWLNHLNVSKNDCQRIYNMICASSHSGQINTEEEAIFCDIDLAILGAERKEYLAYSQNIRHEYNYVPLSTYAKKRKAVLENLLDRDSIYYTDTAILRYQARAETNIQDEIKQLTPAC